MQPVTHPFVDDSEQPLAVRPGQLVRLTVLMVPGGAVHATCGVLPRTKVSSPGTGQPTPCKAVTIVPDRDRCSLTRRPSACRRSLRCPRARSSPRGRRDHLAGRPDRGRHPGRAAARRPAGAPRRLRPGGQRHQPREGQGRDRGHQAVPALPQAGLVANPRTDAIGDVRHGAHLAALQAGSRPRERAPPRRRPRRQQAPGPCPPPADRSGTRSARPAWASARPTAGRGCPAGSRRSPRAPDGQRAYIGTANGGTWYTDDAGAHWRSLDTYAQTASLTGRTLGQSDALSVGAIAVLWDADPSKDVVYVGTGEPNRSSDSFFGIGIKVAKGPATTDPLDPRDSPWSLEAPGLASKAIYPARTRPGTAGVVYAATTAGLWRRTLDANGLPQWAKVFDPAASASGCSWLDFLGSSSSQQAPQIYVTDVAIGRPPANPQTIYAAVQDVGGQTPQQVWASQSGNDGSWQAVPATPPPTGLPSPCRRTDPSVVYALSRGTEPAAGSGTTAVPTNPAKLVNGTFQPLATRRPT